MMQVTERDGYLLALDGGTIWVGGCYSSRSHSTSGSTTETSSETTSVACSSNVACFVSLGPLLAVKQREVITHRIDHTSSTFVLELHRIHQVLPWIWQ